MITTIEPNLHNFACSIMLITMALEAITSRDRIARYCGGFEIHCRKTRGFKSLSRRFTCRMRRDFASIQTLNRMGFWVKSVSIFQVICLMRLQELLNSIQTICLTTSIDFVRQ